MTSVADQPRAVQLDRRSWSDRLLVPEMWGTLAISLMWLAVLFDGIYGGDIVAVSNDGNSTRIPSAVAVALFAFLATAAVAKRAFARRSDSARS